MKKNTKLIGIALLAAGLVMFFMVYTYVFQPYQEKTEKVNAESNQLASQVDYLREIAQNSDFYLDEMDRMNNEMNEMLNRFAVYYQPEDIILMERVMEQEVDYFVDSSMQMQNYSLLYATGADSNLPVYELYNQPIDLQFESTYQGIKDIILFLQKEAKLKTIQDLSIALNDQTELLQCSMTVDQFILTGTNKMYENPVLPYVNFGTNNLFRGRLSGGHGTGVTDKTVTTDTEEESDEEATTEGESGTNDN